MNKLFAPIKHWFYSHKQEFHNDRMSDLRNEAVHFINIRPYTYCSNGEQVSGYALTLGGHIVEHSKEATVELLQRMLFLREVYIEQNQSNSPYELL